MIGSFGDVVFEVSNNVVRTFDEMKRSGSARYAEHVVIAQKPRLEFLGPGLIEIGFKVTLMACLGVDANAELKKLREARDNGEARRLVLGEDVVGKFVIESISEDEGPRSNRGALTHVSIDISLKEYIDHV